MTFASLRIRPRTAALGPVLALVLSGCQDGFFYDPAPTMGVPLEVSYSFAGSASSQAAGPGDAFDKADAARFRVLIGGQLRHEETVTFQPGSSDKRVTLQLEIDGRQEARLEIELRAAGQNLFTGGAPVTLTPGQTASVDVPLTPVETGLTVGNVPSVLRLQRSRQLTASTVFATGDAVGTVNAGWQVVSGPATVSASGLVTATGPGQAVVRATYQSLSAQASFDVVDPCTLPPATLAVGQTVSGTLSRDEDCLTSTGSNRLFDEYRFTAPSGSPFTVTMTTQGVGPFFPISDGTGQQRAGHGANDPTALTRQYLFPGGSWTLKASAAQTASGLDDAAEGSYTVSLQPLNGPVQDGCVGTTGIFFGVSGSGTLQGNDCPDEFNPDPSIPRSWDGFSMLALAGEEGHFQVVADFPLLLTQWVGGSFDDGIFNVPAGEPAVFSGTADVTAFHAWYVINQTAGGQGNYTFSFNSGPTTLGPNLVVARGGIPASAPENTTISVTVDLQNVAGPLGAGSIAADVYVAAQPNLSGPNALLGQMIFSGPLDNADEQSRTQTFTLPLGVRGPHYVLIVIDPSNAIAESGENNLFSLGLMDIT